MRQNTKEKDTHFEAKFIQDKLWYASVGNDSGF